MSGANQEGLSGANQEGLVATSAPPGPPRRARVAVSVVFVVHGAVFASWAPRIPEVKRELGLSDGALGLALLGPAVGSLTAMVLAGALVARVGSRAVTRGALVVNCLGGLLVPLAGSLPVLFAVLALWATGLGALDLSMNAQAVAVEKAYQRSIMVGFHAAYSLGALIGAGAGTAAAALGIPLGWQMCAMATAGLAAGLPAGRALLPADVDRQRAGPVFARPSRALAILGALAFASLLCEGAAADWSAVYLRERTGSSAAGAGAGFTAFSLAMLAGRLVGDRIVARAGPVRAVRWLALIATAGLGAGLALGTTSAGVVGFAALGLGLSCVVPVLFTAAGSASRGESAGPSLAAVATCGYVGFLTGPVLIGGLGSLVGLPAALAAVVVLTAVIALFGPAVRPRAARPPDGAGS